MSNDGRLVIGIGASKSEFENGPQLAATLRLVTRNLRAYVADQEIEGTAESLRAALDTTGVLEAEALLKRIDEGGDHG